MADINELEKQISNLPIGYVIEKIINEKNITINNGKKMERQKTVVSLKKKQKS